MLLPRLPVPALSVDTVSHGRFELAAQTPENFTLVVFYRGLHCPICAKYLMELERLVPEFEKRGVSVIAVSSDGADRGAAMASKIGASALRFGYGLGLAAAREWGLYISTSRGTTRSVSRSPHCSRNRACSWCGPMARSTMVPSRPCPLPAPTSPTCWVASTSRSPTTTRREVNTAARFDRGRWLGPLRGPARIDPVDEAARHGRRPRTSTMRLALQFRSPPRTGVSP